MIKSEHDELLGRGDPFEFWLQEASIQSGLLHSISPAEALGIIRNAFSTHWLDQIVAAKEKGNAIQSSRHPLASLILVPGKVQTNKVLELGIYLRALHAAPNIDQVIRQMKSGEDFENTWLQIAYGFRFFKVGASDLKFEPDVDAGKKADIIFNFESQTYLAECFMPEVRDSWIIEFAAQSQKHIFDFCELAKKTVCIKIFWRAQPPFTHIERKLFEQKWKQLIQNVGDTPLSAETNFFKIQIQEISTFSQLDRENLFKKMFNEVGCKFAYKQSMMKKNDVLNTLRGKGKKTFARDLLFFHTDEVQESMAELVSRLSKKMEKKVSQLKKKDLNAKGLLIAQTPLIHPNNATDQKPFERLRGKVVNAHDHVDAAIIVHRIENVKTPPGYQGTIFQASNSKTRSILMDKINDLEAVGPLK